MPHNVTALSACQKMYCVDVGEGAKVGRLGEFIQRPVGNFRHQSTSLFNCKPLDNSAPADVIYMMLLNVLVLDCQHVGLSKTPSPLFPSLRAWGVAMRRDDVEPARFVGT